MFTLGLEKEFFCLVDGEVGVVPKGIPADSCGWLVEARGKPSSTPREAVYSLLAEVDRLQELAAENEVTLSEVPFMPVPRGVRLEAQRRFEKGRVTYQNLYGYERHRNRVMEAIASTQVTMKSSTTVREGPNHTAREVGTLFDFPRIIGFLDDHFDEEIRAAKRNPGFYEMKSDGMVEYRSLPNTISSKELIEALDRAVKLL